MTNIDDIDAGYRMSVEVLLNLNHDRYKSYFTQFIVLHFGIFTVYNSKNLEHLTCLLSAVGVILAIVWFFALCVIREDIKRLWELITDYEDDPTQSIKIKINESRASKSILKRKTDAPRGEFAKLMRFMQKQGSGKLMLSVPILFIIVHGYMFFREIWGHLTC